MSSDPEALTRADLDAALAEVYDDVDKLTEAISALIGDREQGAGGAPQPARVNRWCWRTVTGADRAQLWGELAGWVDWFNSRYGTARATVAIPPCWPRHPVAVEELTGLMLAWQAAHTATAPSDAPLAWHDRWLWPCLDRLRKKPGTFEHCTDTKHELRHTVAAVTTSPAALEEAMNADPPAEPRDDDAAAPARSGESAA